MAATNARYTLMKVGGELLETTADLQRIVSHVLSVSADGPLVVVHGGGRELSAELTRRGVVPELVDGIRVTGDEALAAAVGVLGGTINTRLVAALGAAGVPAVGLTGVDGGLLRSRRSPKVRARSGAVVDLGHVGLPLPTSDAGVLRTLCAGGWVPVIASIGITAEGEVLNVNADVAACHLAIARRAERLLVLGATDGVLDDGGSTIEALSPQQAEALIDAGGARDGMAAKLEACIRAHGCGVRHVRILNGRAPLLPASPGTRIVSRAVERAS
jgi:acetylglutamate kinase